MTTEPTKPTEPTRPPQVLQFEGNGQVIDEIRVGDCRLLFIQIETKKGTAREIRARFPDGFELILAAAGRS